MKKLITRRRFLKLTGAAGAGGFVASYPVFIERNIVLTTHYRIPVPNLPEAFSGLHIVHLTDLHLGKYVSLGHLRGVINRANKLGADMMVLTGDYVHNNNTTRDLDALWPVLRTLSAPEGVYSVLGNHDHWASTERALYWMEQTPGGLHHSKAAIHRNGERIWFIGAGDLWESHKPLDDLMSDVPESECRIVLAHNPDTADTEYSSRVDLMLSGHTHGGQIRIPFYGTLRLPVKNKNYTSGVLTSLKGYPLFISRGIGWAIYPVRFNCYPEIAVLELTPKA